MAGSKLTPIDIHTHELFKGSFVALFSRVLASGTAFLFSIVLARTLGIDQTGLFFLALAIATSCGVIARLGLDNSLVRFAASHAAAGEWSAIGAIYRRTMVVVFVAACIAGLVLWTTSYFVSSIVFSKPALEPLLRYMALSVVPMSLVAVHAQILQGLRKVGISHFLQGAMPLLLVMIGLLIVASEVRSTTVAAMYVISALFTVIVAAIALKRELSSGAGVDDTYKFDRLVASSASLYPASIMDKVVLPWSATIMLGIWASESDLGMFSVARRVAMLISFALFPVSSIAAPKFAALFSQGNRAAVKPLARTTTFLVIVLASPVIGVLVFVPDKVMGIFGSDFVEGSTILLILATGQFINVITGSVAYLLIMSGHERQYQASTTLAGILILVLGLFLIPVYGAMGAALSTATSVAAANICCAYMVWRYLGFVPWPALRAVADETLQKKG